MKKIKAAIRRVVNAGQEGFTLVEVLVVVAILGILAAVVLPNFTGLFAGGEKSAFCTERRAVQAAVDGYMADSKISVLAAAQQGPPNITAAPWNTYFRQTSSLKYAYTIGPNGDVTATSGPTGFAAAGFCQ